jgi:hypothetical protein
MCLSVIYYLVNDLTYWLSKSYIWNCLGQHRHVPPCITDKISPPCQLQVKLTGTSSGCLSDPTDPALNLADLRTCSRQILSTCCVWDTWSHFCVNISLQSHPFLYEMQSKFFPVLSPKYQCMDLIYWWMFFVILYICEWKRKKQSCMVAVVSRRI